MLTLLLKTTRFLVIACCFVACPAYSQDVNSSPIGDIPAGKYRLETPVAELLQPADPENRQPLTYFWKQTVESGQPVSISAGSVTYIRDGETRSARYELKGSEFWMLFESPEGKKSYTVYQFEKIPGGFRISREDPYIREVYTFKQP